MARKGFENLHGKEQQVMIGGKAGFWEKYAYDVFTRAEKSDDGRCEKVRIPEKDKHHWNIMAVGARMENINNELEKVNAAVKESKKILQDLTNELIATSEVVNTQLTQMTQKYRSVRMTAGQESRDILKSFGEVKSFFLDYDYDKEQAQMERFIKNAKEFRELME